MGKIKCEECGKHGAKYKCNICGGFYCGRCASELGYECGCCVPTLEKIIE